MLATNIEDEVRGILQKAGKDGWLRVSKCAELYAGGNASNATRFYRWRKQVGKGKVKGFQILALPGNVSFIGLETASPSAIRAFISEDKKLSRLLSGESILFWKKLAAEDFTKIRNMKMKQDPDQLILLPEATQDLLDTYPYLDENLKVERAKLDSLVKQAYTRGNIILCFMI